MIIPGKPLHAETQRHVARMSSFDDQHIQDLDLLIRELIYVGAWDGLSCLCVVGPTAADSLLNLKHGGNDSVLSGAPTFVADRGFTTSTAANIIDTQTPAPSVNPSVMAFGCYPRVASLDGFAIGMGATMYYDSFVDSATLSQDYPIPGVYGACFVVNIHIDTSSLQGVSGYFGGGGTSYFLTSGMTGSAPSTSLDSGYTTAFHVGSHDGTGLYLDNQYAAWWVGGNMASVRNEFATALQNYLTRRGAAV